MARLMGFRAPVLALLLVLSILAASTPSMSGRRLSQDRLPGEEGLTDSEVAAKRWLENFVQRSALNRIEAAAKDNAAAEEAEAEAEAEVKVDEEKEVAGAKVEEGDVGAEEGAVAQEGEDGSDTSGRIRGSQVLFNAENEDKWVPRCNATLNPESVYLAQVRLILSNPVHLLHGDPCTNTVPEAPFDCHLFIFNFVFCMRVPFSATVCYHYHRGLTRPDNTQVGVFANQPADRVTRFVPTQYEVMPYVEMRTTAPFVREAQVAVRGLGIDTNAIVGSRTNPVRRVCGNWAWTDSGVYSWQVYAAADAEVRLGYYYRQHGNNGAAAGVLGAYLDQEIDVRGRSGLISSGNRNIMNSNSNSDMQGRAGHYQAEFDNRAAGEVNKITNTQVLGPVNYRLGRG